MGDEARRRGEAERESRGERGMEGEQKGDRQVGGKYSWR